MQWYPLHVKGGGFCFLYSIQEVLSNPPVLILTNGLAIRMCAGCGNEIMWQWKEYPSNKIHLELSQTRQLVLDHLCHNSEQYLTFYTNISCNPLIASSDLLLEEIICFFGNGNFNTNTVDLLVQICADALSLEIFIFQK